MKPSKSAKSKTANMPPVSKKGEASEMTLEEAFGSVIPSKRPEDFKAIERAAKEEKAVRTIRKMRQGTR